MATFQAAVGALALFAFIQVSTGCVYGYGYPGYGYGGYGYGCGCCCDCCCCEPVTEVTTVSCVPVVETFIEPCGCGGYGYGYNGGHYGGYGCGCGCCCGCCCDCCCDCCCCEPVTEVTTVSCVPVVETFIEHCGCGGYGCGYPGRYYGGYDGYYGCGYPCGYYGYGCCCGFY